MWTHGKSKTVLACACCKREIPAGETVAVRKDRAVTYYERTHAHAGMVRYFYHMDCAAKRGYAPLATRRTASPIAQA